MPFGVMGGQFQPTGQVHLLTNVLDYDMDVQQALDLPRGFHYDGVYQLETGISDEVMSRLEQLDDRFHESDSMLGVFAGDSYFVAS